MLGGVDIPIGDVQTVMKNYHHNTVEKTINSDFSHSSRTKILILLTFLCKQI